MSIPIQRGVVLVDFWAEWCGPCKKLAPVLDQLAKEMPAVTVAKVNVDEQVDLARSHQIMSVPTLVIYVDGKPVDMRTGFVPLLGLRSWVEQYL